MIIAKNKVFFLLLTLFPFFILSQDKGNFVLSGTVLENEVLRLDSVTITVYEDADKVLETMTKKKGKFEIALDMNKDYIIEFSKLMYVSKSISVSTQPPNSCKIKRWEQDILTEVSLFKYVSGVNYSMYKRPVAYFEFSEKCAFIKDELYAKTVSAMQGKLRDDVTKVQKKATKSSEDENKMKQEQEKQRQIDEKYKQLISLGDGEFNDKDYESARQIYTEALKLKPGEIYPETQLMRVEGLIARKKKEIEKQKVKYEEVSVQKQIQNEEKKTETVKQDEQITVKTNKTDNSDLIKTEKKAEALLLLQMTSPPLANVMLENEREMEKANDMKTTVSHANFKRIFLEEIADSKVKLKQQKSE